MSTNILYKLGLYVIATCVIILLMLLFMPAQLLYVGFLITLLLFILFLPFLYIRRLMEPIGPFALMFMGVGTSSLRLISDDDYHRILTMNGVTSIETAARLLIPVLELSILALIACYMGYFLWRPKPRSNPQPTDLSKVNTPYGLPVVALTVVGLLAYIYLTWNNGGVLVFIQNPFARSMMSQQNLSISGSFYWLQIVDLMMLANLLWYSYNPKAFRNPWYIAHLVLTSMIRLSFGTRYPVITFWIALFVISVIHSSLKRREAVITDTNLLQALRNRLEIRLPILRTLLVIVVVLIFALLVLGVRQASTSGQFDQQSFQRRLESLFSPQTVLDLLSGHDFMDADILILIQRDFGKIYDYFYGQTYLELFFMPIPRFLWHEKPELLSRWIGQTYLRSDTTGMPAGITGELYMNYGIAGTLVGMFAFGLLFRRLWTIFDGNLHSPKMICLYAVVFSRFIPSLTIAGITNASIYYFSFLIPLIVIFSLISPRPITKSGQPVQGPRNKGYERLT